MNFEDCHVRVMRMEARTGPLVEDGDTVDRSVMGGHVVEGAGVDVPSVVLLWMCL